MADSEYKKYTQKARRGIKGEAFFESLIVDHAIPHRIARQNDLGVDFLCEWTYGDRPTGILFSAQVKSTTSEQITCEPVGKSTLNSLDEYILHGGKGIDDKTICYWKGLGLPAFLFQIVEGETDGVRRLDCFHKRYTPLLDGHDGPNERDGTKSYYQVNSGSRFLAFADSVKEIGGFARDLVIDYYRLSYSKGHVVQMTPNQLGFWPFSYKANPDEIRYFNELIGWNREKIKETSTWSLNLLERLFPEKPS
jgi:hypothetical protein